MSAETSNADAVSLAEPTPSGNDKTSIGKEQVFFEHLTEGFQYLRRLRDGETVPPPPSVLPSFLNSVAVNFIDPTTSSISSTSSSAKPVRLYEKFTAIFEREYNSTLSFVPYSLIRNNSNGVIEKLPISTVVARSHGGGVLLPDDDTAKSAFHDYSWERPYCHVYLAACESLEHYRTKVKPSIQAFCSQLEAATKQSRREAAADSPVRTKRRYTPQPRYVVIYIPTGDRDQDGSKPAAASGGLASRLASAARQRMATRAVNSNDSGNDISGHSGSATNDDDTDEGTSSSMKLGKVEREIAKRFAQDFPSGNVCTLSNLMESDEEKTEDITAWEKLEWNSVMKAIASAVSGGFQDRCYRFDDELRKLDLMRRGEAKPTSAQDDTKFHLVNFFLVKESFAFTFEQMRLPAEALLHYEELRAFLPEPDEPTDLGEHEDFKEFSNIALCANILEFRRALRSQGELEYVSSIVEEYVFAREISLLFQMHKSIKIAQRFLEFHRQRFDILFRRVNPAERDKISHLQRQTFRYCWGFRCAGEAYLPQGDSQAPFNATFARCLCDVLEFAKNRFMWLGTEKYPETQLSMKAKLDFASFTSWGPWSQPNDGMEDNDEDVYSLKEGEDFLASALESSRALQHRFLDLTTDIVRYNELCGRDRIAAFIRTERMELLYTVGQTKSAAEEIRSILRQYKKEKWNSCHFALLLRLASIQRGVGSAAEYLQSLVHSFSESSNAVAPSKAIIALHNDLERVVTTAPGLQGLSFEAPPLFQLAFGLDGRITPLKHGQDRNLLKKLYTVGDDVKLTLRIFSHLPKDSLVDNIEVSLVPFPVYVSAMEDNLSIEDKDVYKKLSVNKPTMLTKGENNIDIDWSPPSSGQFIMATCSLIWNGVIFHYTAKSLRRPTIRIDIVPRKPTQTATANPKRLIPGHEQTVELALFAGSETIVEGKIQIIGSPGLQVNHESSGKTGWFQSLEIPLEAIGPGSTTLIKLSAKVIRASESDASVPPLIAKISTKYRIVDPNLASGSEDTSDHDLEEIKIPVAGESMFSFLESKAVHYSPGCCMLSATLRCNADNPVTTKSWHLSLPNSLKLSSAPSMNEHLMDMVIIPGQKVALAFDCSCDKQVDNLEDDSAILDLTFENEQGKSMVESLRFSIEDERLPVDRSDSTVRSTVSVACSSEFVSLGEEVKLRYTLQLPNSSKNEVFSYLIDSNDENWIVRGQLAAACPPSASSLEVEVTVMPVQPGVIYEFPSLGLIMFAEGKKTTIPTKIVPASEITVVAPLDHFSVGFPISVPGKQSRIHI